MRAIEGMTKPSEPTQPPERVGEAEALIDQEAAEIDARSPDAPEQIAELAGEAEDLGLPTPLPSQVDVPDLDDA